MNQEGLTTGDRNECEAMLQRCEQLRQEIQALKILENSKQEKRCRTFWQRFLHKPAMILLTLGLVGILGAGAWGGRITVWSYYNGNDYRKLSPEAKKNYASGLYDGMLMAPAFGAPVSGTDWLRNCTGKQFSNEQLATVLDKYLEDHPEEWPMSMNVIGFRALRKMAGKIKYPIS
jgi:hypothetical protein